MASLSSRVPDPGGGTICNAIYAIVQWL